MLEYGVLSEASPKCSTTSKSNVSPLAQSRPFDPCIMWCLELPLLPVLSTKLCDLGCQLPLVSVCEVETARHLQGQL